MFGTSFGSARLIAGLLLAALSSPVTIAESTVLNPAEARLTGDWYGRRTTLSQRGVDVEMNTVLTYQRIVAGGYTDDDDLLGSTALGLTLDTGRAGAWSGGMFWLRGEGRYGDDVQAAFGGLSPLNVDALSPNDPDRVGRGALALTELVYEQRLTRQIQVFAGLLNSDQDDDNPVSGNLRSRDRFLNAALLTSPVRLRLSPAAAPGIGLRVHPSSRLAGELRVYASGEATGESLFDFNDGTTVATEWSLTHVFFNRPGRQLIGFRYGFDRHYNLLGSERSAVIATYFPDREFAIRDDTWALYYNVAQRITEWGGGRGWGIFGRLGYGDNAANPVDWNIAFGAGGNGLFATRPRDTFGFGYYHFYQVDGPLLRHFAYDDEQGWEVWYNTEVTPWLHVTADLEFVDSDIDRRHGATATPLLAPGGLGLSDQIPRDLINLSASDLSWIFGLRAEIRF